MVVGMANKLAALGQWSDPVRSGAGELSLGYVVMLRAWRLKGRYSSLDAPRLKPRGGENLDDPWLNLTSTG